jgi:phytoene desaturase
MKNAPPRILVIGAGPGGLAASLLLAKAGCEVRILERMPRVGGRCSAFEMQGFRFDVGPTFFLYPLVLQRIFRLIGRRLEDEIPMVRLDPQYRILFGSGGEVRCSPDMQLMKEQVQKINQHDAQNIERFLTENRHKLAKFRPALESPFRRWRDLLSWELMKLLPILRPWKSLDSELNRYFDDPRIRLAFSFQSKYLGMSPFNCPSLFSILSFLEYEYGVHHPIGGCSAVSEGMARVAEEMGVTISLDEEVQEILFEGKKAVGVRTNQGEYRADCLVINADFAQAMTKLVPNQLRKRWSDEKLAKKRFSCSTFMMYLGIDGVYNDLDHHTIYTSEDYIGNLSDIEDHHRLSNDPSVYVQNACITDPSLAPEGKSTIYVLAPVSHDHPNIDWKKETAAFREKVLKQMPKLGIEGLESRIECERIITTQDWIDDFQVFKGATFNLAHNLRQMLHFRPQNRFEELDQVYLVGGGTHPGSGLPVIYESARISSRLLLKDFGMDTSWLEEIEPVTELIGTN